MPDADAEDLISRLSGGLNPADRKAFRKAAESALATPDCSGEGSTYRVITKLWRSYFHPPRDPRESRWYENRQRPTTKLIADGPREDPARTRRRARGLRVVG